MRKKIGRRLKGYQSTHESHKFVILRDQDLADCSLVKNNLKKMAQQAGYPDTLIRIACRELESWYLADLNAVEKAFNLTNIQNYQNKKIYRFPDLLQSPSSHLKKLTKSHYQKIEGSRLIGQHLDPDNERSLSFKNFLSGIRRIIQS